MPIVVKQNPNDMNRNTPNLNRIRRFDISIDKNELEFADLDVNGY